MKKICKDILRRCALLALTAALFLPIAGEMVQANTQLKHYLIYTLLKKKLVMKG